MAKATWMVRAEAGGVLFERFKSESFVAMGLSVGSLESLRTRKQIADDIRTRELDWAEGKDNSWPGMLHGFQNEMSVNDAIVTYDFSSRIRCPEPRIAVQIPRRRCR